MTNIRTDVDIELKETADPLVEGEPMYVCVEADSGWKIVTISIHGFAEAQAIHRITVLLSPEKGTALARALLAAAELTKDGE